MRPEVKSVLLEEHVHCAGQGMTGLLPATEQMSEALGQGASRCATNAALREGTLGMQRSSATTMLGTKTERRQQALQHIETTNSVPAGMLYFLALQQEICDLSDTPLVRALAVNPRSLSCFCIMGV